MRISKKDRIFNVINYVIMIAIATVTLYPFLNTLAISLNDAVDSTKGGITLWPREFTWYNYQSVLKTTLIYHAAWVSVLRTATSTILQLFCTAMLAYTISRKDFILKKFITIFFVLTMYFNGGIIPNYFLTKSVGLLNNFWVYVIPGLISAFNLIVIRTFMEGIPDSFVESAKIDGAGHFRIFIKIMIPLCKPVLATIALFIAVWQWNSWFDTFLYCSSETKLSTLQYELMKLLSASMGMSSKGAKDALAGGTTMSRSVSPLAMRATITIIATVPILFVYPFLQKYFVTGLTVGGVKG